MKKLLQKSKYRLLVLSVIILCVGVCSQGTAAWFTHSQKSTNIITTDGVSVALVEQMEQDGVLVPFPADGIHSVMPGRTVSKIVTVRSTGGAAAWVRVRVQSVILSEAGEPLPLALENGEAALIPQLNLTDWTRDGEWYYYNQPLAPGAETEAVIEGITFHKNMDNPYQDATVNVTVLVQAVQSANNSDSALTAVGWPAED